MRLTSAVFAPAFACHDIPAERLWLEPAPEIDRQPDTLGPVVEGWRVTGRVKEEVAAALQLWVDPSQPLAAAELGRLLKHPGDGDTWLRAVLDSPGEAFKTLLEVERIADATRRMPLAGPLEAFDAVMDAVGIRETCLRWGGAAQRLGNLDALRAQAHRYVATCQMEGAAATVAGLVAPVRSLVEDERKRKDSTARRRCTRPCGRAVAVRLWRIYVCDVYFQEC